MAIVKRFGPSSADAFLQFVEANSPSWVTRDDTYINIDDGFVQIRCWRGRYNTMAGTYRNNAQVTETDFYWNNAICTLCYADDLFWLQLGAGGKRVCVVYQKFSNGLIISGILGTQGSQGTMDFQPINNFSLLDMETSQVYTHKNILNYSVPLGCIDYGPDSLFTGTVITDIVDPNFITCSTVTQDRVITFNGSNYYSVGPHTIIPIDPEE